ncbi:hypothetical protein HUJ04_012092 [Dendroctonus ponderosae]|nr:hypothetical protein HUJ04_012092 [Dendroctonus ponderosae]KAH1029208.1 hypothetical protein HUJ05_002486 [Dendroctonus ponderosae]
MTNIAPTRENAFDRSPQLFFGEPEVIAGSASIRRTNSRLKAGATLVFGEKKHEFCEFSTSHSGSVQAEKCLISVLIIWIVLRPVSLLCAKPDRKRSSLG